MKHMKKDFQWAFKMMDIFYEDIAKILLTFFEIFNNSIYKSGRLQSVNDPSQRHNLYQNTLC